ncbi:hypothetical protein ACFYO1_26465 [Nocardia sp. NPDC006044]|uniref:hypothetical protein n=1 Tax=Nocardia sp. NPDC006044 TaxID=3364306 RepID=UPI0036C75F79
MTELIGAIASWPTLLLAIAFFGFAPGFVLRIMVKVYPYGDPRRQELIAELYAIQRIERPLFVAEQLEVVLVDAIPQRLAARRRRGRAEAMVAFVFASVLLEEKWEVRALTAALDQSEPQEEDGPLSVRIGFDDSLFDFTGCLVVLRDVIDALDKLTGVRLEESDIRASSTPATLAAKIVAAGGQVDKYARTPWNRAWNRRRGARRRREIIMEMRD